MNHVRPGGRWDYKRGKGNLKYENFGNFNFGATGKARRFSDWKLYFGADVLAKGGPDDYKDKFWIGQGIAYYEKNFGK